MAFFLFLLVNATLFIRPMEIVPELQQVNVYQYLMLASMLLSIPDLLHYFSSRPLWHQPISVCVLGLFVATLVPQLASLNVDEAIRHGEYFAKLVCYYLLAVSLVRTPRRLRIFCLWLVLCCVVMAGVAVLRFHEVITLPNPSQLKGIDTQRVDV